MNRSEFYYSLPEDRIAQTPAEPRDSSRLMVYDRKTADVKHMHFFNLTDFLGENDLLVINNTKVLPARICGIKTDTKAKLHFLLYKRTDKNTWETLCRPAKRAKLGAQIEFAHDLRGTVIREGEAGERTLRFEYDGVFETILDRIGEVPLPHYIHAGLTRPDRYQTVYARESGSSAAPTAGLHFTERLIAALKEKGVEFAEVLLHVGLGTFLPVKTDDITHHKMHSEYYSVTPEAADKINAARKAGKRIIAVGTTSVRVLESVADDNGVIHAGQGETNIFIHPPYSFKVVDAMITNFHLPESTLIMLVSAFIGREKTLELYKLAVNSGYRFFSFGDACFFQ